MKRKLQLLISASAASVLALSALAQVTPAPNNEGPEYTKNPMRHAQRLDRLNGAAKASDLIGMPVKNYQNEKLGKVEDLAVDVESGRVLQVIVSTGGFIGIGETLSAVPPNAFHHDVAQNVLHLDANKEKMQNAPKFEMSKWADYSDSNHLAQVYSHYGQESTLGFIQSGNGVQDGQSDTANAPNTVSTRKADGTWNKDRVAGNTHSQWMIPASRLGQVQQASKLLGTTVNNLQDEKLGQVENLLVDLSSGRIVAVVISSGGFLGIGDELSAVPPTALRFTSDRAIVQLDASKEMLSSAPHFQANQWPNFADTTYASGVYRAYKVEPYFTANPTSERDNTARNVRDRNHQNVTPLDQGNSDADVTTTAQIRKEIVAGKGMSVNAQNVKIITNNGQVTLRGPVNSAEEKRLIGEIANRIARSENVENLLEVKMTTSSNN